MPIRIQRKRAKGFNLQAASIAANGLACVSVTRPSKWGNPFVAGDTYLTVDGEEGECVSASDAVRLCACTLR